MQPTIAATRRVAATRASTDGETFTEVASASHDAPLGDSVLYYYVTSSDPTTQTGDTVRLDGIEACQG